MSSTIIPFRRLRRRVAETEQNFSRNLCVLQKGIIVGDTLCYNTYMQTFNIFPELFTYSLMAPLILRLALGFIFINLGYLKLSKEKFGWISSLNILNIKPAWFFTWLIGLIEIIGGLFLIIGSYTQLIALILGVIAFCELFIEYKEESILKRDFVFYLLLVVICISLLLTGAGLFARDVPML